jgi:GAF domain-containing protein
MSDVDNDAREMADAHRRAEQLYRFAVAVATADKLETLFDAALSAIETALGVARASILTLDDEKVMRFRAWRNLSEGYRRAVDGHSPWAPDATAPEPVLVADVERDPSVAAYRELFRSEGIGALAFIPLTTRGRLVGKFMLYYEAPHEFLPVEIETALGLAHHVASLIARFNTTARLEETLRANELFAAVLAHDLQNPLGAIMTAAQVLLRRSRGGSPESDRDLMTISRILSSGQRMATMITQLLDFTEARQGRGIRLRPRETKLDDLAKQARASSRPPTRNGRSVASARATSAAPGTRTGCFRCCRTSWPMPGITAAPGGRSSFRWTVRTRTACA